VTGGTLALDYASAGAAGSTNAPAAFSIPAGNAMSKNGDTAKRFLGSVLTNGSSTIRPFQMRDLGGGLTEVLYLADTGAVAPFKILDSGSQTSYTAINMSTLLPSNGTVCEALLTIDTISGAAAAGGAYFSVDNAGYMGFTFNPVASTSDSAIMTWMPVNPTTTTALYYKVEATSFVTVFCWGYRFRR
jgi:hypothetical protein